jgi:hypothetical protein
MDFKERPTLAKSARMGALFAFLWTGVLAQSEQNVLDYLRKYFCAVPT